MHPKRRRPAITKTSLPSRVRLLILSFIVAVFVPAAQAQTVTATLTAGTNPVAVAVNPLTNKTYVVNKSSNNVTVIDGATNATTRVSAGGAPVAVAVNPLTNKIYVSQSGSKNVTGIDVETKPTSADP